MQFQTFIPIDPLPCPRPRVRVIKGKNGKSFGHAYYEAAYKNWTEEFLKILGTKQFTKFAGPLRVRLVLDCRKARTSKLLFPGGDVDNYAKSVLDGLTHGGIWDDDKQVVHLIVTKRWAKADKVGIYIYIDDSPEVPNDQRQEPEPVCTGSSD
jgi:Holliday junction resolvase RusA-like endonuclease